jgi:hypothetical protein
MILFSLQIYLRLDLLLISIHCLWIIMLGSMSVNVSTAMNTGKSEYVNPGTLINNGSPENMPHKLIPVTMIPFLLHVLLLSC